MLQDVPAEELEREPKAVETSPPISPKSIENSESPLM